MIRNDLTTATLIVALVLLTCVPQARSQFMMHPSPFPSLNSMLDDLHSIQRLHRLMLDTSDAVLLGIHTGCTPIYSLHQNIDTKSYNDSATHIKLSVSQSCSAGRVPMHNVSISVDREGDLVVHTKLGSSNESFTQRYNIPHKADLTNIAAEYTSDDILHITIPKRNDIARDIPVAIMPRPAPVREISCDPATDKTCSAVLNGRSREAEQQVADKVKALEDELTRLREMLASQQAASQPIA